MSEVSTFNIQINSQGFWKTVLQPSLIETGAAAGDGILPGSISENFVIMDSVSMNQGAPLIDVYQNANILQDATASCAIDFKDVANLSGRRLYVKELIGASKFCGQAFFQGAMKDIRTNPAAKLEFYNLNAKMFKNGLRIDNLTNAWMGDESRAETANNVQAGQAILYSLNRYDGIVKRISHYLNTNVPGTTTKYIAAGQSTQLTIADANFVFGDGEALQAIKQLYDSQSDLMQMFPDQSKVIYVDNRWYNAYRIDLTNKGLNNVQTLDYIRGGVLGTEYNGIEVRPMGVFNVTLAQLNAANPAQQNHYGVLTLRQNFMFGLNKDYQNVGPYLDLSMYIYYDNHSRAWKYEAGLTAGIDILAPQFVCQAYSSNIKTIIGA